MKIHLKILTFTNEVQNAKSTEIVHLYFFLSLVFLSLFL